MALTDKQLNFINEYIKDMNASAAYLRAGYNCSEEAARRAASRLLTNVDVQDEIKRRTDKIAQDSDISVQWVLTSFKEIAERCMQAVEVTDREGNSTGEYRFDSSGANKALENIGKYLGMFTDKVKMDMSGTMHSTMQDVTGLSPEERRARIDELNRRRGNGTHSAAGG
jgi:phage terminase small subunit